MTLAEELRRKYALTSLKAKGSSLALLAINEALQAAAEIADQEHSPLAASRIRSLKWTDQAALTAMSIPTAVPLRKTG
ncbi:MAG: hypothetical protein DMG97_15565 [Acidobacteria bacterium]|nr:MAG: hypothetical protein DMG97_15565 [Acidobacteriota bacterium]